MSARGAILAACLWGAAALADDHAVVLIYHHVSPDTPGATSVTPEVFESHLEYLERHDFNVWPLARVLDTLAAREPLPRNTIAITFDDAYRSVYTEAWPRLRRRGWPFTVFVNSEAVDRGYATTMSWAQLRELTRGGGDIGNHSHTHDHLVRRRAGESESDWRRRVRRDIETAAARIEAETGTRSTLFAYPYGEYSDALKQIVRDLGLRGIAQQSGAVGYLSDPLAVPRFPLARGYDDTKRLATAVNARPLPVRAVDVTPARRNPDDVARLRLELEAGNFRPQQLACYGAGGKALAIERNIGTTTEIVVDVSGLGRPGRNKVNCTAPALGEPGAFFWYSFQWLLRNTDGSWYEG